MTTPNKQAITTFLDALGQGDSARMAGVLAEGSEARAMGTGAFSITRDRETILAAAGMLKAAIPAGIDFTITSMTEEGDRVVAEVEGRACLADGTRYDNTYAFIALMRDGKIAHMNEYYCTLLVETVLVPFVSAQSAGQDD
ncbi:MAG: nuclear transport factor 2 family protein [Blastomonas sp.]|jgi:ketosteroid isomerase-like protein